MSRIVVFASGTRDGGGSGFQELVENSLTRVLNAQIVAVVSHYADGGVRHRANRLSIPFVHFPGPWSAEGYQNIVTDCSANWIVLSGWLKHVKGLDSRRTINIHPGLLPRFGGPGMYGHHVHGAVIEAFKRGEVKYSVVSMHFVTEEYDKGPVFFQYPVLIREDDTPESLAGRVNKVEHGWQSWITNLVVHEYIQWDGENPESLTVPSWYTLHKQLPN